mmetsp:Transcript_42480/g.111947  ORF Transcript_42480/g.111947 Transcript_42480/m.111947 type:complete len:299 (+) Transcript_42480:377-1273(+)
MVHRVVSVGQRKRLKPESSRTLGAGHTISRGLRILDPLRSLFAVPPGRSWHPARLILHHPCRAYHGLHSRVHHGAQNDPIASRMSDHVQVGEPSIEQTAKKLNEVGGVGVRLRSAVLVGRPTACGPREYKWPIALIIQVAQREELPHDLDRRAQGSPKAVDKNNSMLFNLGEMRVAATKKRTPIIESPLPWHSLHNFSEVGKILDLDHPGQKAKKSSRSRTLGGGSAIPQALRPPLRPTRHAVVPIVSDTHKSHVLTNHVHGGAVLHRTVGTNRNPFVPPAAHSFSVILLEPRPRPPA